ncbi:helix-turn-helix transcriptional regulator [Catenuloplanes atrovinosus]|uniref:DNA-binding NarL/FixJ family response regulator n=1 Tax=Catenuloplanes atrovinosus TaxID=137266 RepID=A0AAE3YQH3_9ACTN|nr:LuxR C-terminal-related transcriptional regulator [Catenuloplanes atrovinosus]MDR7275931.1 DNA-binding NarL/FixJ family response regulator [Catenuloplanes atrovinosus]
MHETESAEQAGTHVMLPPDTRDAAPDVLSEAQRALAEPGLVVLTGGPGSGRTRLLARLGEAFSGPVFAGGGLATLRDVPAFALTRAVRVRLPGHDAPLLAEAVRARVRGGLLVLDDLQWADPVTLAALPLIAAHTRVAVALRTPHRVPGPALAALRAAAAAWLAVPPLTSAEASALVSGVAPGLDPAAVAAVVRQAGGSPLACQALARHAQQTGGTGDDAGDLRHAIAGALADLTRPARTAMAALGLLGRPVPAALLGSGAAELADNGLIASLPSAIPAGDPVESITGTLSVVSATTRPTRADLGMVAAVSPYVAEVAAGMLDADARAALHRRLARLVPPREAVRHLAAAGDTDEAYRMAVSAARTTNRAGERAELLLLACRLPGAVPDAEVRVAAARAALATGQPAAAAAVLAPLEHAVAFESTVVEARVLRAEALLQAGDLDGARHSAAGIPAVLAPELLAARDRVLLLTDLADDPAVAVGTAASVIARHGEQPAHTGLRAALAAVAAARRAYGWENALASATAAAGDAGDALTARWSAWVLVETLAADGRLPEAAHLAQVAAGACQADLAYSWQTRFVAAGLWAAALRGHAVTAVPAQAPARAEPAIPAFGAGLPSPGQPPRGVATVPAQPAAPSVVEPVLADLVVHRAGDLMDRSLPALARAYAAAAAGLVEADAGLLGAARARLDAAPRTPVAGWVAAEIAWLDGQPDRAAGWDPDTDRIPLLSGLHRITARWAALDGAPIDVTGLESAAGGPTAIHQTLSAWAASSAAAPSAFAASAAAWSSVVLREQVRCLIAQGLHEDESDLAVRALLTAEDLAERAGLVVLRGRAQRALRRHSVRRDIRGPRAGDELTAREQQVMRLVAAGDPTRRIAGQLGVSAETVETHIRSAMRKLGARTRTEAAVRVREALMS